MQSSVRLLVDHNQESKTQLTEGFASGWSPPWVRRCTALVCPVIGWPRPRAAGSGWSLPWVWQCTALACLMIRWTWQRAAALGWSPDVAVFTVIGIVVYRHPLSSATASFHPRLVKLEFGLRGTALVTTTGTVVHRLFSLETWFSGFSWVGHCHP